MGTNFYATVTGEAQDAHLGKRSGGWPFLFHAEPGRFATFAELVGWFETTPGVEVHDEYGRRHDPVEFVRMARRWGADSTRRHHADYTDDDGHQWLTCEFS